MDYQTYGLRLRSQIALPELFPATGDFADVDARIEFGRFDFPPDDRDGAPIWATPDTAILRYPGTANYRVSGGRSILIDLAPAADENLARLYLLGPVLAILLHQRGLLVLHASAVEIGGQLVAFLGDKGAGKSTMAAAFCAAGHPLLADDLIAVDTQAEAVMAFGGFPQLKLFPESAALLGEAGEDLPTIHPGSTKRAWRSRRFGGQPGIPLKLRCAFVLADADENSTKTVIGPAAFMAWVRHSYLLALLNPTRSAESHFRQVTALARQVPLMQLSRRRSLQALAAVVTMVEEQLERAA